MPRTFRVLLDEPLDANGSNKVDANGSIRVDADGSNSQTQMEGLVDANGSNMVDANGTALNSLKHPLNTNKNNTSSTQHARARKRRGRRLIFGNSKPCFNKITCIPKCSANCWKSKLPCRPLSPGSCTLPVRKAEIYLTHWGMPSANCGNIPCAKRAEIFRQFADLPPAELLMLIDTTPTRAYEIPTQINILLHRPGKRRWVPTILACQPCAQILFGEGASE